MSSKLSDIQEKIKKEEKVLEAALRMIKVQTEKEAQQLAENSIKESQARLSYLQGELAKMTVNSNSKTPLETSDSLHIG